MLLSSYTRALKRYDPDLYAGHTRDGVACVFRKIKRYVPIAEWDGGRLMDLIRDKQIIFAITDTWLVSGKPRQWGIDDVLGHVKKIDAFANARLFDEMDAENDRVDQSKRKAIRNEMEGFWSYERRRFAKTMDENMGLTHSVSKDEPKKRLRDKNKEFKDGNR